jgi:hypothetical protein
MLKINCYLFIYLFYAYDSEITYLTYAITNIQYNTYCIDPPCFVAAGGGVVLLWLLKYIIKKNIQLWT